MTPEQCATKVNLHLNQCDRGAYEGNGQSTMKLSTLIPMANGPNAPPTPPKDRSISLDSGIGLGESELPPTPPSDNENSDELFKEAASQCCCALDVIEDIYGCTPLQEAMMAQTMKEPGAYTIEHEFYLSPEIDPQALQSAWEQTAKANPALRTRMVTTPQRGCMQVVLRGPLAWQMQSEDEAIPKEMTVTAWKIGGPLAFFSFNTSRHILQIKIHHSICDKWSVELLLKQTEAAFHGEELIPRPFRPLVEYTEATQPQSNAFWESEFENAHESTMSVFPRVPSAGYSPTPCHRLERSWDIGSNKDSPGTVNSRLRLAWAILQSVYTGTNDVLFGAVSTGRGVPVEGIQKIAGPTLASVPVRIKLDPDSTVSDAVSIIQTKWGKSMPYEHIGLQNLLHLSPGTKAACQFQTLMSVEPQDIQEDPSIFSQGQSVQSSYNLFALILRCRPSSQGVWIEMSFDPEVLDLPQGERIMSQLAHIYDQVGKFPKHSLSQIECISPEDTKELSQMTSTRLSFETPLCVHELFQNRVAHHGQAPAICSWDGNLSYQELDNISSALAVHLSRYVQHGDFVPLCIGRSKWVAIAMLAVMKAGGAFVLLDTMHPIPRLQQMCQTAKATLLISSRPQLNTTSQLDIRNTIVLDDLDLDRSLVSRSSIPGTATPDDPVYATFTSGSTGIPKCVIVHHAGYASSALAHGNPYRFTPTSRVLQFASPAFDSCIIEHLSTLIMGGCVCIPSADDCHSNLGKSIQEFGVTVTCLTPTVTRIMNPKELPTLDVMVFVGEAVLARDVQRWKPHVQVVGNAYGPAECSAVFSVQPALKEHDPSNIGFPTGGIGWVVHPDDPNRLMPLGCTGELLVEGLIVGKGYLSNPDQTARAFIERPQWRTQFQPAATGLFYKTGDLVEYTGDGSFRYHRRKDTQAKLHGQRLELGEIEHHLRTAFGTEHVVAEIIRSIPGDNREDNRPDAFLTAFVHHPSTDSRDAEKQEQLVPPPSETFRAACVDAEMHLSESLPQFMIPNVFLPLSHMPLTPSGKTNRRCLQDHAQSLSWASMQKYRGTDKEPTLPSTVQQDSLRNIWAETLNRPVSEIGVDDSFFRLGGDSVSAMQMAASCQAVGFNIVAADIFRCPTIQKLSDKLHESGGLVPLAAGLEDTQTETWFELSPIQQLFFDTVPDGHDQFTMEFILRITRPLMETQIQEAMRALSGRHCMLRARFERNSDGRWGQIIGDSLEKDVCFQSRWLESIHDHEQLKHVLVSSRERLDPRGGTVMVVDLINTKAGQFLSFLAHHTVIDLVSWRVLLQDLEDILTTGRPLQPASISFQQWCKLQRAHIMDETGSSDRWASHPPPPDYWGPSATKENSWAQATRRSVTVGREATQALLGTANDSFHTRPVELIQTAILYSFVQVFDDRQAPAIFNEGHGREPWDARIDISRTVGWFTTISPLFLDVNKGHDIFRLLELTKDGRRRIPGNGFTSFARRYLHMGDHRSRQDHLPMEILFNYTGLFQQLERTGALLQLAPVSREGLLPMPGDLARFALIDVNAVVMDGSLTVSFIYNQNMNHQQRILQWIDKCQETLETLPPMLQQEERLTLSDLPLLSFADDSQLRDLLHNISLQFDVPRSNIQDIYPCSPLQLGIYISQLKNPQAYWSHLRWSVRPAATGNVNLAQVKAAWQRVVDHNPILRTVFIENTAHTREPVQVVLKSTSASISEDWEGTASNGKEAPGLAECFHLYHRLPTTKACPPHLLHIACQPDGSVLCQLTIHHVLVDGATEQIFLHDFDRAYRGILEQKPAGKLSSYVEYLAARDLEQSKAYWKDYLQGLAPCMFPSLDVSMQSTPKKMPQILPFNFEVGEELNTFCRQHNMTASSLLQVAWGLVLRAYTGSESVCFGYLHSCRDLPIHNVSSIAGPMVNILVCRLLLNQDTLALEALLDNHEAYATSLEHQHCSLAEMVHSLQLSGKSLFNTVMSIQKDVLDSGPEHAFGGVVKPEEGVDSTEYDLTVNIAISRRNIRGDLTYWTHFVSHSQAKMIADAFHCSILQLLRGSHASIDDLKLAGSDNMDHTLQFNASLPTGIDTCIHTQIKQASLGYPDAQAVCAWDGDFTYGELQERATAVAQELSRHSVDPDTFVPILSEKSKWEVVSILAVLKAGGAFILLDPAQPQDRLRNMIHDDFECPVIVSSCQHAELAASIVQNVVLAESVGTCVSFDDEGAASRIRPASPRSACYAVFSSGSTGKPKASVIEHRSFLSAAHHHGKVMRINSQSRVLHFASNAFDAAILEILSTLLLGGCVCIPSDDDRNNQLESSIAKLEANWTLLTPSVSRILEPQKVPTLQTLVFGGERMSADDIQRWSPYVTCMNAYGPSEASIVSTCQSSGERLLDDPSNIGNPTGAVAWVISSQPPHHPVPIGAIGELAVEGPIVGRGYVNRPDNMKKAFLPYPEWLRIIRNVQNGVLYRTGDLVRMMPDGSLTYLGRGDNQVKLRGQRIELAEVEYQVQRCYPEANPEVIADLVVDSTSKTPYLVASIVLPYQADAKDFKQAAAEIQTRLHSEVPSYLVPSFFFPVEQVPRLVNGKIDRRKLQKAASLMVETEIRQSAASRSIRRSVRLTPGEQVVRRLWADTLNRPADAFAPDDDFFSVGGDSVAAMKLSSAAAARNINISVSDVFLHPTLKELARIAIPQQSSGPCSANASPHGNEITEFALLPEENREDVIFEAARQCSISVEDIEDIYPCTALQMGLVALTAQFQGAYVVNHRFRLAPGTDLTRLRLAWEQVMAKNDILRTRLVALGTGNLQVLLRKDELLWSVGDEPSGQQLQWEMVFGQPLVQFVVVPSLAGQTEENDQFDLVITMHHAMYDVWSLSLLIEKATLAYHAQKSPNMSAAPFRNFVAYTMGQEDPSLEYWAKQLHDLKADQFPLLPSPSYRPRPSIQIERTIHTGPLMDAWVSRTTAVRLSWALVQSQYQNSDDVVFGIVSNGRTAPVHGIEAMVGPTIATYPLRVQIDRCLTGSEAIANLHDQTMELSRFEQVGLSKISALGADGARACDFQVLLMELRGNDDDTPATPSLMQALGNSSGKEDDFIYAIQLAVMIKPETISVAACFDPDVVSEWQMNRLLDQFGHILQQVHTDLQRSVEDITTISPQGLQQLQSWHPDILDPGTGTVVDSVHQQCVAQPSAPAVTTSTGNMSYQELDLRSNALADILISKGAGPGCFIPIYIERSQWVVVAMLGILKTGAAFALLDALLPHERLRAMCTDLGASLIVSSDVLEEEAGMLSSDVVAMRLDDPLPSKRERCVINSDQSRPLYVSFTSGSTGAPKGIVVNNNAFIATVLGYSRAVGLGPQSRVLQCASYAFDSTIIEILPALMAGASVCIMSESERRDSLAETIAWLRPNQAILTPSALRSIDPATVCSLDTVVAVGESIKPSDIQHWAPYVTLMTGYGPTEAAVAFTMNTSIRDASQAKNIGLPLAGAVHVADPSNPRRLAPVGAVGELLLQSAQVSQGYLNNPEQTSTTFIAPPPWLKDVQPGGSYNPATPVYRTGDLVRYGQDGSLWFIGRKDDQLKLRGQRLEPGKIEEQVKRLIPGVKDVVAEMITPSSTSESPWLAAFITWHKADSESPLISINHSLDVAIPCTFADAVATALRQLEDVLPSYMVPSLIVPLQHMLHTPSGKIDRRSLRELLATIPRHELYRHLAPESLEKRAPSTKTEVLLRDIWTRVLHVPADEIGLDDSFVRLGGDSISAMRATSEARSLGIEHSVGDLVRLKTISEVSKRCTALSTASHSRSTYAPFSLVSDSDRASILFSPLARDHLFVPDNVEDVLPTTAFQAFYITHSSPVSMARRFETYLDVDQLRSACQELMAHHSILRTVFVGHNGRFFQVILKELDPCVDVIECDDPEEWVRAKSKDPLSTFTAQGSVPLAFTVVTDSTRQHTIVVIRISHAQYDGISIPVLWEDLIAAYQGEQLRESGHFRDVVSCRLDTDNSALSFWKPHLKDAPASAADPLDITRMSRPSKGDITVEHTMPHPQIMPDITPSTLVKAALSWVLSRRAASSDIILGQVMHGRGGTLPNIERTLGPCLNQLPMRIILNDHWTVEDLLHDIQTQQMEVIANDNISFDQILRHCTSWPEDSTMGCFVHHQGLEMSEPPEVQEIGGIKVSSGLSWGSSKMAPGQVAVLSIERESHLELRVTAAESTMDEESAALLAREISDAIELFANSSRSTLAELR